jgi:hypothetical protein
MQSVGGPGAIVATVITLVVVPVYKDGKVSDHKAKVITGRIKCEPGKRIPSSAEAKRLGVAGQICRKAITRVVASGQSKSKKNKKKKKAPAARKRVTR